MELVGEIQTYDWGKLGEQSIVAQLAQQNDPDFKVEPKTAYAEIWMGNYPSGQAKIKANGKPLSSVVRKKLKYMLKVLSIRKALSIQVHPNKKQAKQLNKKNPEVYKDKNHKPELAIALTKFVALCGFRPYQEIYEFCKQMPCLKKLVGGNINVNLLQQKDSNEGLRKCFETLMKSKPEEHKPVITEILSKYEQLLCCHKLDKIFAKINEDFPGDVGVLCVFFLNVVHLQPGQSIFLAANEIHAYISGDCVEVMACSDNVIRAGLTPKFKDVDVLLANLNYEGLPPQYKLFEADRIDANVRIFNPPVNDFSIIEVVMAGCVNDYKLSVPVDNAIMCVVSGRRNLKMNKVTLPLRRGSIVHLKKKQGKELEFLRVPVETPKEEEEVFLAYIAMKNTF